MRTLSSSLTVAQQQPSAVPYAKVTVSNKTLGVDRYHWSRLYDGSEDDYYHAVTMPGDGSLVRVRITLPADSRKLYYQRVAGPGPERNYSAWTYTGQYSVLAVAAASLGEQVSLFWVNNSREVRRIKSTDYGVNWGSPELIDYSPSTQVYGMAAAYKPNGDLTIFLADQSTLYQKKCLGGAWQNKAAWDKTTGDLSGLGCFYDGDWDLVVSGKDTAGNYKLWSIVFGDGGEVGAGTWSALKELTSAPAAGSFEYKQPFLDKTDVFRCFYVEKFTGNEAYSRPFFTCLVPGTGFKDGLWEEPVPFNLSSEYGLAMAHYGDYAWLTNPDGVWRAPLTGQSLELTDDVIGVRQEIYKAAGNLVIELRNDDGRYASLGEGALETLVPGCQIEFSPGYITYGGVEYSEGQTYCLDSLEHTSAGGKASLSLRAGDGWSALNDWHARHQFRWNKGAETTCVKDILAAILARAGLKLETITQSSVITSFYPDFTVNPDDSGAAVIQKLLTFVPDGLFIEGNKAYLVNPQSGDSTVYSYGTSHAIFEGKYRQSAFQVNRVQAEGLDSGGAIILAERFAWDEVERLPLHCFRVGDRNLNTVTKAQQRGDAYLRQAEMEAEGGYIKVPVNCGQQLFDVVEITDSRAGLVAARKRVLGMVLVYQPARGEYYQKLALGSA